MHSHEMVNRGFPPKVHLEDTVRPTKSIPCTESAQAGSAHSHWSLESIEKLFVHRKRELTKSSRVKMTCLLSLCVQLLEGVGPRLGKAVGVSSQVVSQANLALGISASPSALLPPGRRQ